MQNVLNYFHDVSPERERERKKGTNKRLNWQNFSSYSSGIINTEEKTFQIRRHLSFRASVPFCIICTLCVCVCVCLCSRCAARPQRWLVLHSWRERRRREPKDNTHWHRHGPVHLISCYKLWQVNLNNISDASSRGADGIFIKPRMSWSSYLCFFSLKSAEAKHVHFEVIIHLSGRLRLFQLHGTQWRHGEEETHSWDILRIKYSML